MHFRLFIVVKMSSDLCLFALCLVLVCSNASALYFHMDVSEDKCFILDYPDNTNIEVKYKVKVYDERDGIYKLAPSTPAVEGLGMRFRFKDPNGKILLSRTYGPEGKLWLMTYADGQHVICLHYNTEEVVLSLQVHLNIKVIGTYIVGRNLGTVDDKGDLSQRMKARLIKLNDMAEQISMEQSYARYREENFRNLCQSINFKVIGWLVAQGTLLLMVWILQIKYFKRAEDLNHTCVELQGKVSGQQEIGQNEVKESVENNEKSNMIEETVPTTGVRENGEETVTNEVNESGESNENSTMFKEIGLTTSDDRNKV